jgi:TatA/E family protein of Tat protein translocase
MMHTVLFVFEFLGTTELLVIAVVALILFGPRKLPEIGRSLGKGIAEFKRASDDFKRTWEYEVEIESRKPSLDAGHGAQTAATIPGDGVGAALPAANSTGEDFAGSSAAPLQTEGQPVARTSTQAHAHENPSGEFAGEGAWDVATGHTGTSTPHSTSARHTSADEDEINAS